MFNKNFQRENKYELVKQTQGGVDSEARGILLTIIFLSKLGGKRAFNDE